MAFDRAADFHAAACGILAAENSGVLPGERAVVCALLAQTEVMMGIAELLADDGMDDEARASIKGEFVTADDSVASASILLLHRLQGGG